MNTHHGGCSRGKGKGLEATLLTTLAVQQGHTRPARPASMHGLLLPAGCWQLA